MGGRGRGGRDRFVVVARIPLWVAGGVTRGFVLANRAAGVVLTAQHTAVDANKQAGLHPPANFDHFDFSSLWLAINQQPSLPIHGRAAYLVDLDTRQVMWARDPETSRAPASLTKLITAMGAARAAGPLGQTGPGAQEAGPGLPH